MSTKEEILKAFNYRRAIKVFEEGKKIPEEDFDFILETARLSPSSFGWEPWKFLVIQNMALRKKLMEPSWGAQRQLPTASHFVVMLARKGADMTAGSEYLDSKSRDVDGLPDDVAAEKIQFFKGFQQNEFDLTDDRKIFDWAGKQVYLAFANMMTAAAQIGIDSCPIEGFDRARVEAILADAGTLDTDHFGVAAMVAFGYRAEDSPFPRVRHAKENVFEWVN
ncbi:MAG: NAD(P)H-dependent oxidoreductase [Spirochaetales bacterium]|uniref:NAD(P)H-dependent oxidoreductase n=1 Tax=Candidatus Thalassospirochaeta sargassi TaxID=3119039 RepID=A0AAJ1IG86_9SPIO|nr:NAD(P)H-dependent oxidoreductase [Spirochaetales bacterium]